MKKISDEKLAERIALLEHAEAVTGQLSIHGETELVCLRELRERRDSESALQQNLNALAAENAALKCKNLIGYVKDADVADVANGRVGSLMPNDVFGEKPVYLSVETPATDAYMNSVRAEGVDMLGDFAGQQYQLQEGDKAQQKKWKSVVFLCCQYAAQLRSGTHDTADKAG